MYFMRKKFRGLLWIAAICCSSVSVLAVMPTPRHTTEKTCFQIAAPWAPEVDVRADVAIVYGPTNHFEQRLQGWIDRGYQVHFMTGIAWGEYQDYFLGQYDGTPHPEDGQVQRNGDVIGHGVNVPYIVPSEGYITYFKTVIKRIIDSGITAIHLEEPEFWARAGYSESFKAQWQTYYGFPWQAQHESPEATYLSSKLKYRLYFNALKEVFAYAKSYSESKGARVRCYVPTHSLLNYSSWQIVSPEASLAALPGMDGYIAQVWTGTSREPTYFNGVEKERVFENAFLEYGSMVSMTAPTGRKVFFLTDPIEDRSRSWDDYKRNYQATFTAQLMYPMVDNYEVMPWPDRIYRGRFPVKGTNRRQPISPAYATQMQVMVNSLNDMPLSDNKVSGTQGLGVLVGNSMMFQRFPTHQGYEDPRLSNFYGMVLPLVKRGIPAETVHMENLEFDPTLAGIKVLVMSYSNMKPLSPDVHTHLANWVRKGGVLLYYGRDNDPFQTVREWWNTSGRSYKAPSDHLFAQMNITPQANQDRYPCGKGVVYVVRQDPKELVLSAGADKDFMERIAKAYEQDAHAGVFETKNYLTLQRGPYDIVAVMDESTNAAPLHLTGPVIDLFDPALPILEEKIVPPGQQAFLYNLSRLEDRQAPRVLCAASRVYSEQAEDRSYAFITKSPSHTQNVMRILLPAKPVSVTAIGPDGEPLNELQSDWHAASRTCMLRFENYCDGVKVTLTW